MRGTLLLLGALACSMCGCMSSGEKHAGDYDVIIRNGLIYDGNGSSPYRGDVALRADTIAATGNLSNAHGRIEINASGLAVAPGFVNMLSWATESLLHDGR